MSIEQNFYQETLRLRREKFPNVTVLAEEAYAVLNTLKDKATLGKTTVKSDTQEPALSVLQRGIDQLTGNDRTPKIRMKGDDPQDSGTLEAKHGALVWTPDAIPEDGPGGKGFFQVDRGNGQTESGAGSGGATAVFMGKVISGTGSTYIMDLYGAGITSDPTISGVTVTQASIASGETIPAGSWEVVVKAGGAYFMQFPVWG